MLMGKVRKKAKKLGIKSKKMRKADLIWLIQEKEGNIACFQNGSEDCDQHGCCWRKDCLQN